MTVLPADLLDTLCERIRQDVAAGFDTPEAIAEGAGFWAADGTDSEPDDLRPVADRLTAEALLAHQLDQATWPDETDCDRLDTAFAELEAGGVVCRQNFTCCGTCGAAEIGREMAGHHPPAVGYAFYHMQDTESAVEGCGLCLNYGAAAPGEAAALAVAGRVVAALGRHGLATDWDGTWQRRIAVRLDWKRRRPVVVRA